MCAEPDFAKAARRVPALTSGYEPTVATGSQRSELSIATFARSDRTDPNC